MVALWPSAAGERRRLQWNSTPRFENLSIDILGSGHESRIEALQRNLGLDGDSPLIVPRIRAILQGMTPEKQPAPNSIPVSILGATGSVGQRFVSLLENHPWFVPVEVRASERSAGKTYRDATRWSLETPIPASVADLVVQPLSTPLSVPLVFSALDAEVAGPVETRLAEAGALVVSNAKSHRMDELVPLVVPEINADHLELARAQPCEGAIVTNPNCSTIGVALALEPLRRAFGLKRVSVVTMQALSGAGLQGVPGMETPDNVIPYIGGEEEKLESEMAKLFGSLTPTGISPAELVVSAQCNRVSVVDGHTACVSVEFDREVSEAELRDAWSSFQAEPQRENLPLAPERPTRYLEAPDAPQPKLHRDTEKGMAVSIGRLRPCPVLQWKFVCLSHNTLRGAAGGSLLLAENAVVRGLLKNR